MLERLSRGSPSAPMLGVADGIGPLLLIRGFEENQER